jgi:hypothetical protein
MVVLAGACAQAGSIAKFVCKAYDRATPACGQLELLVVEI